jgi:hypothetical protein
MRPTAWVTFLALFLVTAGACEQARAGHGRVPPKPVPGQLPSWTVESGWRTTREEAVQDALERAQDKLVEYLRAKNPPVAWAPPREFVRDRLWGDLDATDQTFRGLEWKDAAEVRVSLGGHEREHRAQEEVRVFDQLGDNPEMHRVAIRVALTASANDEIREKEQVYQEAQQKERALARQGVLGRVLAGLVALLVAVACYLRLEDATKGYYTTLLRLVAVAFVSLVAAGILFLR